MWGHRHAAGVCVRGDVGCFPLGCRTGEVDKVSNCKMTATQRRLHGACSDRHDAPQAAGCPGRLWPGAGGAGRPVVCRGAIPSPLHLAVTVGSSSTPGQKARPRGQGLHHDRHDLGTPVLYACSPT